MKRVNIEKKAYGHLRRLGGSLPTFMQMVVLDAYIAGFRAALRMAKVTRSEKP